MKKFTFISLCIFLLFCGCDAKQFDFTNTEAELSSNNLYDSIINDYQNIVTFRLSDDFEYRWNDGEFIELGTDLNAIVNSLDNTLSYRWECMLLEMPAYDSEENRFGYIQADINGDKLPELFWIRGDHNVLAVFTVQGENIILLDAFWSRYSCVITDDGLLYTQASGGASIIEYEIRKLSDDASLTTETGFSMYNDDLSEYVNGEYVPIDNSRFDQLLIEYPFENSQLWLNTEIIPLFMS